MINMNTAEWGLLTDVFWFGSMQCFSKVDVCVILLYLLISCPEFVTRHREIDASIKHVYAKFKNNNKKTYSAAGILIFSITRSPGNDACADRNNRANKEKMPRAINATKKVACHQRKNILVAKTLLILFQ